jgi:hypothetical protein
MSAATRTTGLGRSQATSAAARLFPLVDGAPAVRQLALVVTWRHPAPLQRNVSSPTINDVHLSLVTEFA